jgi:stage V sporulation protein AC
MTKRPTFQELYQKRVDEKIPPSPLWANCLKAFLVGGAICTVGQAVSQFAKDVLDMPKDSVSAFTAIVMVFLGAFFTGLGLYDNLARLGGAGAFVPITGFSNSIVSPAMEFKREGYVLGIGAKMFSIAGAVLVYGIGTSVLYGIILLLIGK